MVIITRSLVAFMLLASLAAPAAAQSRYIGAALVGDIARFTRADLPDEFAILDLDTSLDGEALGVGISAGTAIGDRWGIEIEFVRPARIERSVHQTFPITLPIPVGIPVPLPRFEFDLQSAQRHSTLTAAAWVRQEVGERFELSYLAGVTFSRMELEQSVNLSASRVLIPLPLPGVNAVEHATGPAIGVEALWKLGDHVAIVPAMRLHGTKLRNTSGWLLRPAIGARWRF